MSQGDMIQLWKYLLLPFFTLTLKIIILLICFKYCPPQFSLFILFNLHPLIFLEGEKTNQEKL